MKDPRNLNVEVWPVGLHYKPIKVKVTRSLTLMSLTVQKLKWMLKLITDRQTDWQDKTIFFLSLSIKMNKMCLWNIMTWRQQSPKSYFIRQVVVKVIALVVIWKDFHRRVRMPNMKSLSLSLRLLRRLKLTTKCVTSEKKIVFMAWCSTVRYYTCASTQFLLLKYRHLWLKQNKQKNKPKTRTKSHIQFLYFSSQN